MTCKVRFLFKASVRLALVLLAIGNVAAQPVATAAKTQSDAAYRRGVAQDQAGRLEDAVAAYSQAIELDPANGPARAALGQAYSRLGRQEEAVAEFTRAIDLSPGDQSLYRNRGAARVKLGQYHEAIQDFNFCLGASTNSADLYIERAVAHGAAEEYQQALEDLTTALELRPDNVRAFWVRGTVRELLDDLEGAISDFTECIRLNQKDVRFRLARGSVYQRLMKHTLSLEDYDEAVKLAPKNVSAYLDRGDAYWSLGKVDQAVADQTAAIRLAPAVPSTWIARGTTYLRLGRYSDALADLKQAFGLDPLDGDTERTMAQAQKGVRETGAVVASVVPPPPALPAPFELEATPATTRPDPVTKSVLALPAIPDSLPPALPEPPRVEMKNSAASALSAEAVRMLMAPVQPVRRKFVGSFTATLSTTAAPRPLPEPPTVDRMKPAMTGAGARSAFAELIKVAPPAAPAMARPSESPRVSIDTRSIAAAPAMSLPAPPVIAAGQTPLPAASSFVASDRISRNSPMGKVPQEAPLATVELPAAVAEKRPGVWVDPKDTVQLKLPFGAKAFLPAGPDNQVLGRSLLEGDRLLAKGRYAKAIDSLSVAIKIAPRSSQAFTLRGYARLRSMQYKQALDDFNEAIRLNPSNIDAYRCRAFARSRLGDQLGAEEDENKVSVLLRPVITP